MKYVGIPTLGITCYSLANQGILTLAKPIICVFWILWFFFILVFIVNLIYYTKGGMHD